MTWSRAMPASRSSVASSANGGARGRCPLPCAPPGRTAAGGPSPGPWQAAHPGCLRWRRRK
eukprot:3073426-Alexandrium_andersonii.AAC.1